MKHFLQLCGQKPKNTPLQSAVLYRAWIFDCAVGRRIVHDHPERSRSRKVHGIDQRQGAAHCWRQQIGPRSSDLLAQAVAVGGAILFAIVTAWVFGREFSDHTAKELLALPTHAKRSSPQNSLSSLYGLFIMSIRLWLWPGGRVFGCDPWLVTELLQAAFVTILGSAILTIALLPFVALAASMGRGYLPAFGWTIFTVVMAQIAVITGWGDWFPWSVPALFSGAVGPRAEQLGSA